jgi:chromosome segregation ATPase
MHDVADLNDTLTRIELRLTAIEKKIDGLSTSPRKAMEWMGQLAEQVRSLDSFREEVRASLEPLFQKLESLDDVLRILRHATSDVARRVETLEGTHQTRMAG